MCTFCLEKINEVYKFKMTCIETEEKMITMTTNLDMLIPSATFWNAQTQHTITREDMKICRMCKITGVKSNMISFHDFLENNNMQNIYEIHFPEIVSFNIKLFSDIVVANNDFQTVHATKDSVICRDCINHLKEFMDIKIKLTDNKPDIERCKQWEPVQPEKLLIIKLIRMNLSAHM